MSVSEFEGGAIRVSLGSQDRHVIAIVPAADSEARQDGYDFMFMVCSEICGSFLRNRPSGSARGAASPIRDPQGRGRLDIRPIDTGRSFDVVTGDWIHLGGLTPSRQAPERYTCQSILQRIACCRSR